MTRHLFLQGVVEVAPVLFALFILFGRELRPPKEKEIAAWFN